MCIGYYILYLSLYYYAGCAHLLRHLHLEPSYNVFLMRIGYIEYCIYLCVIMQVVPIYYVIFTSVAVFGSAVLYGDLDEMPGNVTDYYYYYYYYYYY